MDWRDTGNNKPNSAAHTLTESLHPRKLFKYLQA